MSGQLGVKRPRRKPKSRFHHGDLAEALVQVAGELVEKDGHAALSLRVLAERLGVTQPALYRHYASKEELLAELAARGLRSFLGALREALAAHADPYEAIDAAGRAYVRHAHAHPGWFRLWFTRMGTEQLMRFPRAQQATAQTGTAYRTEMLATLAGITPPGVDVDDLYRAFWALAHGLATFVVERVFQLVETDEQRIAAADQAIRVFVDALRARGGPG